VESQSKAQFTTLSLGENKIGYRAENRYLPLMKTKKIPHLLFTSIFIPSWYCGTMQSNASCYQFV